MAEDTRFDEIQESAIEKARRVPCDLAVYYEGLKGMKGLLDDEMNAVRDDLRSEGIEV